MAYIPRGQLSHEDLMEVRQKCRERAKLLRNETTFEMQNRPTSGRPRKYHTVEERKAAIKARNLARRQQLYEYQDQKKQQLIEDIKKGLIDPIPLLAIQLFGQIKHRVKQKNYDCDLDIDTIEFLLYMSNGKCSISNLDIDYCFNSPNIASIDRIDSSKGYTLDNVHVTHVIINRMKMHHPMSEFIQYCAAVANNGNFIVELNYVR